MNFSVTRNGKVLDPDLYNWDEKTKVFSTKENNLVLDFSNMNYVTFKTGSYCTFTTGSDCTFTTGSYCTFKTSSNCTFTTGSDCVIVRRDVFEIIQPKEGKPIKLKEYGTKGFDFVKKDKTITIDGKDIVISEESYQNLKKQLT